MTKNVRNMALVGVMAVVAVLSIIIYVPRAGTPVAAPEPTNGASRPSQQPTVIVVSSSVAPFSELAYGPSSTRIVVATVTKLLPAVWDDNKEFIFTPAVVAVEREVKGPSPAKELTVYLEGGTVGDVAMINADAAKLEQGRRYLLFLSDIPRQKSEKVTTSGGHMGVVAIEGDQAYVNVGPAPVKPQPLGQLIANVEAAMRGEFHPTPTPTFAPPPTQIPSGGLYPPKPPRPVQPGE